MQVFVHRATYVKGRPIPAGSAIEVDEVDAKLLKEARKAIPFDEDNDEHVAAWKATVEAEAKRVNERAAKADDSPKKSKKGKTE